ncbi:hypothetical protein [Lactiplantibacillus daowaiensis]|uniref:Integral membrane protein n=1 Tax=Lactiplantibacillus daowaiensis TaxID=2559918 RepID=A0ABW1S167_9LACO|nr:hypothetical protein [Lactiplantibacillus daowaiensis]
MIKRFCVKFGQAIVLIIAGCLLAWMFIALWRATKRLPLTLTPAIWWAGVAILVLLAGILGLARWLATRSTTWLLVTLGGLTVIKLPLIALFRIHPTSDFWNYHALAAYSTQGLTWQTMFAHGSLGDYLIFPHALNIANAFSWEMAFFGQNYVVSQLGNVLLTSLDMLLLYFIGARWLNRQLGISMALIFYSLPAYWLYSTLLNGIEPLFITCILIAMYSLTNVVHPLATTTPWDQWFNLILAWGTTIVANLLRPIMAVWLIGLVLLSGWLALQSVKIWRRYWIRLGLFIVGVALIMGFTSPIEDWLYGVQLAPNRIETAYSVATGSNPQTGGMYEDQLMGQVTHTLRVAPSYQVAYQRIAIEMQAATTQHLTQLKQTHAWLPFLNAKLQNLMTEDYGYNWVLYNLNTNHQLTTTWYHLKSWIVLFSVGGLLSLIGGALISVLIGLGLLATHTDYLNNYFFYSGLLLDGFVLSALLVEVQGRYHIIIYLPLIFLLTCGIAAWRRWRYQERH